MTNHRSAFSLVEMLVAVVLISLLIGVAMFSFRLQLITVKKTKEVGISTVLHFAQLRASLASMKYYVVDDYDMLGFAMKKLHFYFAGTATKIDYITQNPVFSPDVAVVKLECIDDKLIYKEEPLYGNIDFLRPAVLLDSKEMTLFKNLSSCRFAYELEGQKKETLSRQIPSALMLTLVTNHKETKLYTNVQSDYNMSKGIIQDDIYPVD